MSTAMTNDPSLVDLFSEGRTMRKLMNRASVKTSKIKTALILALWNGYVSCLQGNGSSKCMDESDLRAGLSRLLCNEQVAGRRHRFPSEQWAQGVLPDRVVGTAASCCAHQLELDSCLCRANFPSLTYLAPESPHRFQLEQEGAQPSPKKSWAFRQFPKWCLALVSATKCRQNPPSLSPFFPLSSVTPYLCISLCLFIFCLPWFLSLYFPAGCNMRPLKLPHHWLTTAGVRSVVSGGDLDHLELNEFCHLCI